MSKHLSTLCSLAVASIYILNTFKHYNLNSEFHTFIVLDLGVDWLGGFSIPDLIHGFNAELVLLALRQVLDGPAALGEDLAVCHVELTAVGPHLLNIVASNGAAAIGARWLPSQGDGVLASVSVVQLLRGRWST